MNLRKLLGASVLFCASLVQAGRVNLTDIGLSVYVPDGWSLSLASASVSDTESNSTYTMLNAANPDRAVFYFEAYDHVGILGAHAWTTLEGYSQSLGIQGYLFNTVYIDDSVKQDGLFAWRVYGRFGELDSDSLPTGFLDRYSRSFAYGDLGWSISFEGDTADVDTAGPSYTRILDSVKVDRNIQVLSVHPHHRSRGGDQHRHRMVGGVLAIEGPETPSVQAIDASGRPVTGLLTRVGDGWTWTPRSNRSGLVIFRILGAGRDETLRAVLKP